jgi:hypothetical protein
MGRRAARAAERRRRRRKQRNIALAAVAAVALVTTLVVVVGGGGGSKKPGAQERTQQTLLLQVKGADGTAVASALLAHDAPSSEGSVVLVPPQVIATVPGQGSQLFGKALATAGPTAARNALSDLMSVTIDGSWVLDATTFQRLVDQEGGIQATVDVAVMNGRVVVVPAGAQHLSGAQALAFATYLAAGEQEQLRLTRLQAVIDGILNALPASADTLLGSLGGGSQTTIPVKTVAKLLQGLKHDDGQQQLQYRSLPVIKVDTGTDAITFRIDADGTRVLVDQLLAQSVPPGARVEGNRVLVLNGVGTPGLGEKVRAKLVPAGFVFVGSRNAPSFGYAKTQVLVKDQTTAGAALGARVAKALGVPVSSVAASDQIGTIADVVVVVGRDFKP